MNPTKEFAGLSKKEEQEAQELINLTKDGGTLTDVQKARLAELHAKIKAKPKATAAPKPKKKGGETPMAHLSAYDKARKVLKADGIKTDQSTTKQSLAAKLIRMSEEKYKKLGEAIRAEMEAKKAKKAKKTKPAKKAAKKTTKPRARKKTSSEQGTAPTAQATA